MWEESDARFRLIHEPEQGVVHAFNRGIVAARGEYVARMDADDWSYDQRIGKQVEFLDGNPGYGAVAGWARHLGNRATTEGFRRYVQWSNSLYTHSEIFNRRFVEAPVINPTAMWRMEIMATHGSYRTGEFPEDYEMWLRWLDGGVRISKIPEVVLDWYDSESRLTRTDPVYSDQAFFRVKSHYLAKWMKKNSPHFPRVWVWGASRISRRRARILEEFGIHISCYVDTKKGRQIDKKVIYYEDLPAAGGCFLLTYIKQMDNRMKIRSFLESKDYVEGVNYLMIS